jgi:diguanylate cyclase (GGDEF)-like protein
MTTSPLRFDWLDFVTAPVCVLDAEDGIVLRTNEALRRILRPDLPATPMPLTAMIGAGAADCVLAFVRDMPPDGSRNTLNVTCATANGPMNLILNIKQVPGDRPLLAITIDERTLFFNSVQSDNAEQTFRGIIQALPIGIDILDASLRGVFYNNFSDTLYLYDPYYDLEMTEWFERAFPDAAARATAIGQWSAALAALDEDPSQPQMIEWTVMCRDGASRVLCNQISKIGSYITFIYWDITEQRRLEERLRVLASTDMLTGVHNRRSFFEQAETMLAAARQETASLSMLMIDIDHFKAINDSFGHRIGDEALRAVASLCRDALSGTDLLARFGGEEFIVLLPRTTPDEARKIAGHILAAVSDRAVPTTAGRLTLTISIGLATADPALRGIDQLIEQADAALYAAKRAGRNRVMASTDRAGL